MRHAVVVTGLTLAVFSALAGSAAAQDGAAAFKANCAACHAADQAQARNAPSVEALRQLSPESILNALLNGKMRIQGTPLSDAERRAVAEFLGGRALRITPAGSSVTRCTSSPPFRGEPAPTDWNGWGNGLENTRFARSGGLTAADLPRLKLKWAFGFADVTSARAQPSLVGNRLFVASDSGDVHALDPKTGCAYWSFRAQATVRTALLVAPYTPAAGGTAWAVFFGDLKANAYAVDATSGASLWVRKADDHPFAAITGAITYYNGRVFVPVQGLNEEVQGGRPQYECCTFRGSVSALDADSGNVVWKTYTIAEKQSRGANASGTPQWGPGWRRNLGGSNDRRQARRALRRHRQRLRRPAAADDRCDCSRWISRPVGFAGSTSSSRTTPGRSAAGRPMPTTRTAPARSAPTSTSRPRRRSPRRAAAICSSCRRSRAWPGRWIPTRRARPCGSNASAAAAVAAGQWGGAVDGRQAYFGSSAGDGIMAVNLATGERAWQRPAEKPLCGAPGRNCSSAQGAAVTAIPGAVLSGAQDGGLRAYAADDGTLVWQFDTSREFTTVNGVKANGGSMDGPGPIVAGGLLFVNSGYGGISGLPGNVLLVFGVD
jgi:polyvinyl alcohol dehydrogenase (cytochrome)